MATTFRQLLNTVLVNVSEDEVDTGATELTDAYHKLVRNFINTVLSEVQDAHNWSCMRKTCTATVTGGNGYSSNFQYDSSDIGSDSRLARMPIAEAGVYKALAFDITDSGSEYRMQETDLKEIVSRLVLDAQQVTAPTLFALDPSSAALVARVHPIPSVNRDLQFEFYVPQAAFVGDSDDLNDTVNLPPAAVKAVELGATWFALEERGEELGTNVNFAAQRYHTALNTAICRDNTEGSGDDYELVPV